MKVQRLTAPPRLQETLPQPAPTMPPPASATPACQASAGGPAVPPYPAATPPWATAPTAIPEHGANWALKLLAEPEILRRAGFALPLLVTIVTRCLRNGSAECEVLLGELAQQLGHSGITMTHWHRRLQAECGISVHHRHGRVCFELPPDLLSDTIPARPPQARARQASSRQRVAFGSRANGTGASPTNEVAA